MGIFEGVKRKLNRFVASAQHTYGGVASILGKQKSLVAAVPLIYPVELDTVIVPEDYTENVKWFLTDPLVNGIVNMRARLIAMSGWNIIQISDEKDEVLIEDVKMFIQRVGIDDYLERISVHLDIYGNDYFFIQRDETTGEPLGLIPIQPENVIALQDETYNQIVKYKFRKPMSSLRAMQNLELLEADAEDMLHFRINVIGESVLGYSMLYPLKEILRTRYTVFSMMPAMVVSQVFPWIFVSIDTNRAGHEYTKVKEEIEAVFRRAKEENRTQYLIVPDYVKFDTLAIQGGNKTNINIIDQVLQHTDRQVFAVFGMNESILYAKGTTDLLRKQGNELFIKSIKSQQRKIEEIVNMLIDEYLEVIEPEMVGKLKFKLNDITREDINDALRRIIDMKRERLITEEQAKEMVKQMEQMDIPEVEEEVEQ